MVQSCTHTPSYSHHRKTASLSPSCLLLTFFPFPPLPFPFSAFLSFFLSSFICPSTSLFCFGKRKLFNGSIYLFPPLLIMQIISLKKNRKYRLKEKKFHHPQITIINIFMYGSLYLFGAVYQCESWSRESHTYWLCDLEQVT